MVLFLVVLLVGFLLGFLMGFCLVFGVFLFPFSGIGSGRFRFSLNCLLFFPFKHQFGRILRRLLRLRRNGVFIFFLFGADAPFCFWGLFFCLSANRICRFAANIFFAPPSAEQEFLKW
jgi:hypothetical protein